MLTEGDTFTDLDGHVGLVDVLIDSQLKNMYFGYVTGKSRSFQYYLSVLFFFFLPSSKTNAMLSIPRTKQQDNVVMLQRQVSSPLIQNKLLPDPFFKIKRHSRFERRSLGRGCKKKGYEL